MGDSIGIIAILLFGVMVVLWIRSKIRDAKKDEEEKVFKEQEKAFKEGWGIQLKEVAAEYFSTEIPKIDSSDIVLPKSEELYAVFNNVEWLETRRVTKGYSYDGFNVRIPIAKGLSYRMGNVNISRQTSNEWQPIEIGNLYITNKRMFLRGTGNTKSIPLDGIMMMTADTWALLLERQSGKKILLKSSFGSNVNYVAACVAAWNKALKD